MAGQRTIASDWSEADLDLIHAELARCYWCEGIPRATVERAMRGSINFLLREDDALVGYARVISDRATFAYLCDVFVLEACRGRGLGDWLIAQVLGPPRAARPAPLLALHTRCPCPLRPPWLHAPGCTRPRHGDRAAGPVSAPGRLSALLSLPI